MAVEFSTRWLPAHQPTLTTRSERQPQAKQGGTGVSVPAEAVGHVVRVGGQGGGELPPVTAVRRCGSAPPRRRKFLD